MEVNDKLIEKLATLSKLSFDESSKKEIAADLEKILEFVNKLNELETNGIEPLIYLSDEVSIMRNDEPSIEISKKDALKNAPVHDSDYFKVPKVIDN